MTPDEAARQLAEQWISQPRTTRERNQLEAEHRLAFARCWVGMTKSRLGIEQAQTFNAPALVVHGCTVRIALEITRHPETV